MSKLHLDGVIRYELDENLKLNWMDDIKFSILSNRNDRHALHTYSSLASSYLSRAC